MSWLTRGWTWFRARIGRPQLFHAVLAEAGPEHLKAGSVYLIGEGQEPWFAALLCPCGCNAQIKLSLIRDDRPRWKATIHNDGTVTLHPSIWRNKGCKSHFFVRRGRIVWARSVAPSRGLPITRPRA